MQYYRHGDLSFHPLESLPKNLKRIEHKNTFVIAEGEATGHRHLAVADPIDTSFQVFQDAQGRYVFQFGNPIQVSHEEHKTIIIGPGIYQIENEREFNWFEHATQRIQD